MATPMIIGLRIAGTKQRQSGFAPLLSVGVLAGGEGENMDRVAVVGEKPSYIIKHAPDYILYGLIDREVRSFDADAPGVLSIALTIPSTKQLANGASPYTLLKETYDMFVRDYMTRNSDGRDSFLDKNCDPEPFKEIVSQYALEDRSYPYITMNPNGLTGIVCVPQNKLEDFFRNTQYKEFANFKDIEVGIDCQKLVTPGLENLQIPLPQPSYEVYIDGEPIGIKLQLPESPSYKATKRSNSYYTFDTVEISLIELLNTPGHEVISGKSRIKLDMEKSRILCNLGKSEIYYDFVLEWSGNANNGREQVKALAAQGKLKLYLGTQDVTGILTGAHHIIKAIDIRGRKVDISPKYDNEYSFSAQSSQDDKQHKILVNITINKRRIIEKPVTPARNTHRDQSRPVGMNNTVNTVPIQSESPNDKPAKKQQSFDLKPFIYGVLTGLVFGVLITILISTLTNNGDKKVLQEERDKLKTEVDSLRKVIDADNQWKPDGYDNQAKGEDPKPDASDVDAGGSQETLSQDEIAEQKKLNQEQAAAAAKKKAEEEAAKKKKAEQKKQTAYDNLVSKMEEAQTKVNAAAMRQLNKINIPSSADKMTIKEIYVLYNKIEDILKDKRNITEKSK